MNTTHCQICARDIKANTGTIAHHGYQRPGNGWQTSSCLGAKYLPYEESRDRIPAVLDTYKAILKTTKSYLKNFLTNPPKELTRVARYGFQENEAYPRPEDFQVEACLNMGSWGYGQGYEMEFSSTVKQTKRDIESIKYEITFLQERYDNWSKA